MITEPPIAGHVVVLEAGLSPTGTLARLNVSYKPTQEKTSSLASVLSGVNIGLMGLLGFRFYGRFLQTTYCQIARYEERIGRMPCYSESWLVYWFR